MNQPKQKDMPWGKFCLYLFGFYCLLFAFFYLMEIMYQPALKHDQRTQNQTEAAKKLPATK